MFPLTEEHYFKLHGRPSSPALIENARKLIQRVNSFLVIAISGGISLGVDSISQNHVASGHRPAGVNARTQNAAVASTHLTCEGIDIQDVKSRALAIFCIVHADLMEKCGLWLEDPRWTAGKERGDPWCHFQSKPPRSGNRIYVPSSQPPSDPAFYERNGVLRPSYLS